MPIALLMTITSSLVRSLGEQFIGSTELLKWFNLALNVFDSGVDVEGRLKSLEKDIAKRLDAGEHFVERDFDEVVARIAARDQRWADL